MASTRTISATPRVRWIVLAFSGAGTSFARVSHLRRSYQHHCRTLEHCSQRHEILSRVRNLRVKSSDDSRSVSLPLQHNLLPTRGDGREVKCVHGVVLLRPA